MRCRDWGFPESVSFKKFLVSFMTHLQKPHYLLNPLSAYLVFVLCNMTRKLLDADGRAYRQLQFLCYLLLRIKAAQTLAGLGPSQTLEFGNITKTMLAFLPPPAPTSPPCQGLSLTVTQRKNPMCLNLSLPQWALFPLFSGNWLLGPMSLMSWKGNLGRQVGISSDCSSCSQQQYLVINKRKTLV